MNFNYHPFLFHTRRKRRGFTKERVRYTQTRVHLLRVELDHFEQLTKEVSLLLSLSERALSRLHYQLGVEEDGVEEAPSGELRL